MRKIYLLLSMLAIFAVIFSTTKVNAQYTNIFSVNVDPLGNGWTELPGVDPLYGENIYMDIGTGTGNAGKVQAGDIRLTPVADGLGGFYPAGSAVLLGDFDYSTVANLKTTWGVNPNIIKHRENVAVDTFYSYGEFIYKDADNNNAVTVGDTRYSRVGVYPVASVVAGGDTDLTQTLVTFKPAVAGHLEKYTDSMLANNVYDYARLFVDIMWTSDIPDFSADGMRGWQLFCRVDPNVLTPLGWQGAATGYALNDFVTNWGIPLGTAIVGAVNPDTLDVSEQILGTVTEGAGDASGGAMTPMRLVTLIFIPQSLTDHSLIELLNTTLGYQDATTETWHSVTLENGHYNIPTVPEFPFGAGIVLIAAPLIALAYVWRTRPKKKVD